MRFTGPWFLSLMLGFGIGEKLLSAFLGFIGSGVLPRVFCC